MKNAADGMPRRASYAQGPTARIGDVDRRTTATRACESDCAPAIAVAGLGAGQDGDDSKPDQQDAGDERRSEGDAHQVLRRRRNLYRRETCSEIHLARDADDAIVIEDDNNTAE
jgi:hypothetical protein